MSTTIDEPSIYTLLRDKAVAQLKTGTTPTNGQWSMGVDALRLLHRLSSNPDNAGDALKLLHELQVHQVELDLQHEEITTHEQAVAEDLSHYRALYECAPLAYCVVDLEGCVIRANFAAAELFGIGKDHLEGQSIDSFLNQKNRPQLHGLLERVAQSGERETCVAEMDEGDQGARNLQFQVTRAPEREHLLLVCYELGHAQ